MSVAALEVEILNKVTNIGAFAEERAAASSLFQGGVFGGGASPASAGGGIFLGSPGSGAAIEGETKKANAAFLESETRLKNATIVAGEAGGLTDGLARKMNALGQLGFTPGSIGLVAAVMAFAALVAAGKSMIDNADQQEAATRSLAQAYATLGEKVPVKEIQDFINKNEGFVGSMYDAEQGFASLARAGQSDAMQLRLMNDALDLAAAKDISLSAAVTILTSASTGMSRGLLDLGVSQKDVNAALAKGSTESEKYQALLALLEPRIKGARDNTSNLHQESSKLGVEWQKLSNDNGPGLAAGLGAITDKLAGAVGKTADFLNLLRGSEPVFGAFSHFLVLSIQGWQDWIDKVGEANQALQNFLSTSGGNPSGVSKMNPNGNRQRGFTS